MYTTVVIIGYRSDCLTVFSVDTAAELSRSLPSSVPRSPSTHQPRTPRTPRTPGRQDPNKTPRFYPVMKESGTIDGQVTAVSPVFPEEILFQFETNFSFMCINDYFDWWVFFSLMFRCQGRRRRATAPTLLRRPTSAGWWTPVNTGLAQPPLGHFSQYPSQKLKIESSSTFCF